MRKSQEYLNFMEVEMQYRTQETAFIRSTITPPFCKIKFITKLPSKPTSPK